MSFSFGIQKCSGFPLDKVKLSSCCEYIRRLLNNSKLEDHDLYEDHGQSKKINAKSLETANQPKWDFWL